MTADAFIMKDGVDLSTEAQQVLGVVGLLAWHPFRPEMIAAAFQPSLTQKLWQRLRGHSHQEPNFDTIWHELVQAGLLHRESYRLVLADEALYQAVRQLPVAEPIVQELVRIYEELARANEAMTDGHKQHLDAERPHILAILRLCQERKEWIPIRNIHISLRDYWPTCANMADQIEAYEIRLAAAYGLGDRGEITRWSQKLADACYAAADYEKAISNFEQSLDHALTTNFQGELFLRLGMAQLMSQKHQEALKSLKEARRIFAETREDRQLANCLMITGMVHAGLDEPVASEQSYAQAIRMASALNDAQLEVEIESRMAHFFHELGQLEKAIDHFNRALWFYQRLGDLPAQIFVHTHLAQVYTEASNREAALQHRGEALMVAYELEEPLSLIHCSFNMGQAFYEDQQFRQAIIHFQEAVTLSVTHPEREEYKNGLYQLGNCAMYVGEYEAAQVYWQELLALTQQIDVVFAVDCLINLSFIACKGEKWNEARKWQDTAWDILAGSNEFSLQAMIMNSQGVCHGGQGQSDEALALYEQALQLAQKASNGAVSALVWQNKGFAYWDKGDIAAAKACFELAITLAQEQNDEVSEWETSWHLGTLLAEQEPAKALPLLRPRLHYYQKIEHTCADEDAAFVAEVESRLSP